ncbi:FAD-dependent monooxygenase [Haloplanus rallus]|uniref:FAD-dependent monooxygenase n=2 Tax=Haloplanus rallus TaxID=1816183 RepID=A0A6B9FA85_9EURY|nr:FAD-dependent monooxygenase [Haloplanus rallus]QGX95414.1 FAD-dependent monooxygenase [Haloplanus rallus]
MSPDDTTRSTDDLTVTVSGGSMGGLFTGIALDRAGHDVVVFEQSTGELRSRGGGIVAQRSVRRFLADHDVADPSGLTTTTSERRFLTADGDVRTATPDSMAFTSWDAVYRRLRDAFPDGRYHTGRRVDDVAPATGTVTFADGIERAADLVVAAEGGRSSTRAGLYPDVSPAFADYVAWRGVVPESDLPAAVVDTAADRFTFYQGDGLLFLSYFIPGADGGVEPGDRRLNWVWYDTLGERDRGRIFTDASGAERRFGVPPGGLRDPVERRRRDRASTTLPPTFAATVAATDEPFVQAIYDLAVPSMVVDRACLLGDAAFVARPHTAAGTAKAADDAVELAAALDDHDALDAALAAWDRERTDAGSRLVERGKRMGDDRLGLGG